MVVSCASLFLMRSAVSTRRELSRSRSDARPSTSLCRLCVRFCTSCSSLRLLSSFFFASSALEVAWASAGHGRHRGKHDDAGEGAGAHVKPCQCCDLRPMQRPMSPVDASRQNHQRLQLRQLWRARACQCVAAADGQRAGCRPGAWIRPRYAPDTICGAVADALRSCRERRSNAHGNSPVPPDHAGGYRGGPGPLCRALEPDARQEPQHEPEAHALARRAAGVAIVIILLFVFVHNYS